jgi:DNA mismatch repair protein MutS
VAKQTATPAMQQYAEIKARHPGTILFFRMGDFYETFYEDAEITSRVLGLTLTSRNNGSAAQVPLAGVPVKAGSEYIRRLVERGYRVSICEQVEDPKTAKGVVKREVVETVTPGAAFSDDLLDRQRNNFLCSVVLRDGEAGVAAVDISTGEFRLVCVDRDTLDATLARLAPREVLLSDPSLVQFDTDVLVTTRAEWEFDPTFAREELQRQFNVLSLEGFGIEARDDLAVGAAGALLRYVRELQPSGLPHLNRPAVERPGGVMPLDEMTRRNLELTESLRGGTLEGTLLSVLDRTLTPMGARLLRQWILAPLTERAVIDARLDAVSALFDDVLAREALRTALDGVRDIERLAAKVAAMRISPREMRVLGDSIARLPEVEAAVRRIDTTSSANSELGALHSVMQRWELCADLSADIQQMLVDRPPLVLGEEPTIREGFDPELDELRSLRDGGKDAIAQIQAQERERTGINSLKVGYNRVFGYYIEVSNAHGHKIPDDYQRRQTLTGAERYVTPALKEYEEKVLTATERIEARERALFEELRARIAKQVSRLQSVARIIAELDVLSTFAEVAACEGYVRPVMTDDFDLRIVAGRHPVVERMMPKEKFIPNDVTLGKDGRMIILTGPNMAGKSTILRQIGLIVLMAQIGCFVPARSAHIGVVDRLFTRVGASDNLVRGQSTFMVEMSETSAILHSATSRSLVLLDEIGRGTSTYDGVSIAWAVSEHLHDAIGCKTVFATHYHELTQLADHLSSVRNFNVRVREVGDQIVFLHTLDPGGADRSYGIEVGRLAGLPESVLKRARSILRQLEGGHQMTGGRSRASTAQFTLFDAPPASVAPLSSVAAASNGSGDNGGYTVSEKESTSVATISLEPHPVIETLKTLDPNTMTPLQALETLAKFVADVQEETNTNRSQA